MFDYQKFMARYGEQGLPHDPDCYCFIDAETRSEPSTARNTKDSTYGSSMTPTNTLPGYRSNSEAERPTPTWKKSTSLMQTGS